MPFDYFFDLISGHHFDVCDVVTVGTKTSSHKVLTAFLADADPSDKLIRPPVSSVDGAIKYNPKYSKWSISTDDEMLADRSLPVDVGGPIPKNQASIIGPLAEPHDFPKIDPHTSIVQKGAYPEMEENPKMDLDAAQQLADLGNRPVIKVAHGGPEPINLKMKRSLEGIDGEGPLSNNEDDKEILSLTESPEGFVPSADGEE